MTGFATVTTTVRGREAARAMASALVEAKLAACVQIVAIESVYAWQGKIERADEHLLLCKIAEAKFSTVAAAIRERHEYDVPEIVMTPITGAAPSYLTWLTVETAR